MVGEVKTVFWGQAASGMGFGAGVEVEGKGGCGVGGFLSIEACISGAA